MQNRILKLIAGFVSILLVTSAYACWTMSTENCAVAGQTKVITLNCETAGHTYTVTRVATVTQDAQVNDYGRTPKTSGSNFYWTTTTVDCWTTWTWTNCDGQVTTLPENFTTYQTPTGVNDCHNP